ncbi:MAG TPA: 4-vinyl reductase [Bacteroidales bacterium]|nr:4-vinyl reductase [Bacteroidales bacterium]
MSDVAFSWTDLGDIIEGRPNLGNFTKVEVYRLMQYTMRAVLEAEYGDDECRRLLSRAGKISGFSFCQTKLDVSLPLNSFVARLHEKLEEMGIGILRIEKIDAENLRLIVTLSEDLDCSGLPVNGYTVCDYDEGFFAGIFECYTGKEFEVKEIDCWSTGDRTCRFTINPI